MSRDESSSGDKYADRCESCGFSREQTDKHIDRFADMAAKSDGELDAIVGGLRAVIENCKHTDVQAIRHQLVGLLPEVQDMDPALKERLRARGMGHLVERHEAAVRENWADYGYGEPS